MSQSHRSYRVAVLGCGPRSTVAAYAYDAHPRTDVVGICDLSPERLNTLGDALGTSARFSDHAKMIRETHPDIVVIAVPADLHYPLAMDVLDRGVSIDVEKPLCLDLAQADEVVARAEAHGVRIAVHHQYRVGAAVRSLLKIIDEGRIGKVFYMEGACKGYYGGFGLMNIGCHLLNNMVRFGGNCRSLTALAQTNGRIITPEDAVYSP